MQPKPDTSKVVESSDSVKSGFGRGAAKVFYYGFALDSISRSFGRAKSTFVRSKISIYTLVTSIFKKRKFEVATNIEEIESTFISSAHNIVASIFFTILFMGIAFFKRLDLYATLLNLAIGLTFFVMTVCYAIVYLKSKEMLSVLSKDPTKPIQ